MYRRNYTGTISCVLCRDLLYHDIVLIWESPLSEVSMYIFYSMKCLNLCSYVAYSVIALCIPIELCCWS